MVEEWIRNSARRGGGCRGVAGFGHELTVPVNARKGDASLVVVRDPLDRVHSAFRYWRYGSSSFPARHGSKLNFSAFVDAWADEQHPQHAYVAAATSRPPCNWQSKCLMFSDQSTWVDGWAGPTKDGRQDIIFVCYTPSSLGSRVADALTAHGAFCTERSLGQLRRKDKTMVNPTTSPHSLRPSEGLASLSPASRAWLRARYARDAELYEAACGRAGP